MATLAQAILPPGDYADRPTDNSAVTEGRLYFAADQKKIYRDNGETWVIWNIGSSDYCFAWSYASSVERLAASGFVADDLYKLALQVSDNTLWMLTAVTPTWIPVGSGAGSAVETSALLFEGKRVTNQTLTGSITPIDFDSVAVNVDGIWSSGVFTAPSEGLYMFVCGICSTGASGAFVRLYKNSVLKADGMYQATSGQRVSGTFLEALNAGDTVDLRASTDLTLDGGSAWYNWMRVSKLAAGSTGNGTVPSWLANHPDTPPATPNAMNDEFDGDTLDTKWTQWVDTGLTGHVISVGNGLLKFETPKNVSQRICSVLQTIPDPSSTWRFRAKLAIECPLWNYQGFGLILRNSVEDKAIMLGVMTHYSWGDRTSFSMLFNGYSPYGEANLANFGGDVWYMEIEKTATEIIWRWSATGQSYIETWRNAITYHIGAAPNQIGFNAHAMSESYYGGFSGDWFRRIA